MSEQETIADIIAEKRRLAKEIRDMANDTFWDSKAEDLEYDADRLEAAYKRERAKIEADALAVGGIVEAERKRERGDCAKLREACIYALAELEHFRKCHDARLHFCDIVHVGNAKHALETALSAPPRNCDKYTSLDEARNAYMAINEMPEGNRDADMRRWLCDFHNWLFAPATKNEGGNDGN